MVREIMPPPALASAIECFWTIESEFDRPHRNRIVPDGCADIIFDLRDTADAKDGPPHFAVGTMTRPVLDEVNGRADMLGVRFRAGAITPLLGVPATELTDAIVPLDAVWRDAELLRDVVASASRVDRVPRLAAVLLRRIEQSRARDGVVAAADARLRESHGAIDVATLQRELGVGARRLQRLYATHVGVSPRFAARTYRLQHALHLLRETCAPAAQVAATAAYFDQPHLIRDMQELAGITPERYRRERGVASIQSSDAATS